MLILESQCAVGSYLGGWEDVCSIICLTETLQAYLSRQDLQHCLCGVAQVRIMLSRDNNSNMRNVFTIASALISKTEISLRRSLSLHCWAFMCCQDLWERCRQTDMHGIPLPETPSRF